MLFLSIVHHYLLWHYSRAFREIFHVWLNIIWFVIHFFSLPQLFLSWFAPWKRMVEKRQHKWNIEELAGVIIVGLISRVIGFILRTIIISLGLVCLFLTITGGVVVYLFWITAPLVIISALGFGIALIVIPT